MPTNVDVGCCRCGRYTCSPEAGRDCTLANGGGGGAARGSNASAASGGCTPPPTAPDRGSGGRGATAVDAARRPPLWRWPSPPLLSVRRPPRGARVRWRRLRKTQERDAAGVRRARPDRAGAGGEAPRRRPGDGGSGHRPLPPRRRGRQRPSGGPPRCKLCSCSGQGGGGGWRAAPSRT